MSAAITHVAGLVPLCQKHLRAVQDDMVDRGLIPAPPRPSRPPRAQGPDKPGLVYYARTTEGVKIGTTTAPARRWYRLRAEVGSCEIIAAEPGGQELEYKRHAQFVDLRIGMTETFRHEGALVDHLKMVTGIAPDWWESVVLPVHEQSSTKGRPPLSRL